MKLLSLLLATFTISSAQASCLSHQQIMNGLRAFAASYGNTASSQINENSSIYFVAGTIPAAAWQDLDNAAPFRRCGLALGPNDLRYLRSVGELAGVIMFELEHKK